MENTEIVAVQEETKDLEDAGLTKSEALLVQQLRNPASCAMTVRAICDAAGVTTATYYRAFKKEPFVRKVHDECVGIVQSSVLPLLQTARRLAVEGNLPTSHHWAKMLLEMSGLYVPNKAAQIKAQINFIFNVDRPGASTVAPGEVLDAEPVEEVK